MAAESSGLDLSACISVAWPLGGELAWGAVLHQWAAPRLSSAPQGEPEGPLYPCAPWRAPPAELVS